MAQLMNIDQLSAETGVGKRLIRYWIERGLVDKARGKSKYGNYDHNHVRQVRKMAKIHEERRILIERGKAKRIIDAPAKLQGRDQGPNPHRQQSPE